MTCWPSLVMVSPRALAPTGQRHSGTSTQTGSRLFRQRRRPPCRLSPPSSPARGPMGWRARRCSASPKSCATLEQICDIQLGKMLSPKSRIGLRPRPYLRNANVLWNRLDLSSMLEMDFAEEEKEKFGLRDGDVLVCEGGEPGRAAVWVNQIAPCFYQKALLRLRPHDRVVDPYFMMFRLWLGATTGEFTSDHA